MSFASLHHFDDARCDRRQLLSNATYLDFVIKFVRRLYAEPGFISCRYVTRAGM